MKLPLLAALTALSLWGCAHESSQSRTDTGASSTATGGSGAQGDTSTAPAGASEERSWDTQEEPRTDELRVKPEEQEPGTGGAGSEDASDPTNNNDAATQGIHDDASRDSSTDAQQGTGGSGAGEDAAESSTSPSTSDGDEGSKLDATPDGWNKHKGLGSAPVAPSTGTPPTEGSGGASGQ